MTSSVRRVAYALLGSAAWVVPVAAQGGTTMTGRVVSSADSAPVQDAIVRLLGTGLSARTDAAGRFQLSDVAAGPVLLQVRSFGFAGLSRAIAVVPGEVLDLEIELDPSAYALTEVVVEGRAYRRGFYDRWRMGVGRFIPREEIEAKAPLEVTDLLRTIAGVRLAYTSRGVRVVMRSQNCEPQIRIDGMASGSFGGFALDDLVSPEWVEGIEVYRSDLEAPAEFGPAPCGLILIWTSGAER